MDEIVFSDNADESITACATCADIEENSVKSNFANINIYGSDIFTNEVESALNLLKTCSANDLNIVDEYIDVVIEDDTFKNGLIAQTYVPLSDESPKKMRMKLYWKEGYGVEGDFDIIEFTPKFRSVAYAGVLVHEARHQWQFLNWYKLAKYGLNLEMDYRRDHATGKTEVDAHTTEKNFYLRLQKCANPSKSEFDFLIKIKDKMIDYYKANPK